MNGKKWIALLLALVMSLSLFACGAQPETNNGDSQNTGDEAATRVFTDSCGREVTVPVNVEKVAVSGPLAQIVVFAMAPDKLVGIANAWDESAAQFLDTKYYDLPLLGQLYGGKGEMNLETLLAAAPDVVIDVGEPKGSIVEDMDALQEQTGIPFVHIDAYLASMDNTYAMLGDLLAMPNEAQGRADYCRYAYDRAVEIANSVEKANLLYITGDEGLNVIAKGSYHAEAIDLLANNLAVVEEPSSKGTGNEVDMEQILNWNPDVILFAPGSIYDSVGSNENWQTVTAIKNGAYYEVPMGPYNWMGFPPSVQRLLGMTWMAKILYPDAADYDLYTEVSTYFQLFYHCELTQTQYDALVANSVPQADQAA
jgi:iron complex transport system substrate-binding protein